MSEPDSQPHALIEQRGHTLILTLNRPETRNALSTEMLSIMVEAWDRVDNDPEIRSCILTGAGGYFCAGMDLKAATKAPPGDSFKSGGYDPTRIDGLLKGRRRVATSSTTTTRMIPRRGLLPVSRPSRRPRPHLARRLRGTTPTSSRRTRRRSRPRRVASGCSRGSRR